MKKTARGKTKTRPGAGGDAKAPPACPPSPAQDILSDHRARKILGVSAHDMVKRRLNEIASLLFFHEGMEKTERNTQIIRAIELYNSLTPADGLEGMLAEQMVATHSTALECLRRAALPNQTFEGRDMALKHAAKLMALYTTQVTTLDKHRGKGQQKVIVEHVHVEAGGQAIVGQVKAEQVSSRAKRATNGNLFETPTPPALESSEAVPLEMPQSRQTVRRG